MNYLADNVRRFRKRKGWTQAQLMERSEVTSVKAIESRAIASPEFQNLEKLAKTLGVTVAALFAAPPRSVPRKKRKAS